MSRKEKKVDWGEKKEREGLDQSSGKHQKVVQLPEFQKRKFVVSTEIEEPDNIPDFSL